MITLAPARIDPLWTLMDETGATVELLFVRLALMKGADFRSRYGLLLMSSSPALARFLHHILGLGRNGVDNCDSVPAAELSVPRLRGNRKLGHVAWPYGLSQPPGLSGL